MGGWQQSLSDIRIHSEPESDVCEGLSHDFDTVLKSALLARDAIDRYYAVQRLDLQCVCVFV